MGTKERREREKRELRQSIMSAARKIAAQDGWQAVTIRKVADLVEYSPPAIYDYFESKEAIMQELVREGSQKMLACTRQAYNSTDDPEERLVNLAVSYCNFAWDNPELYQVMNGLGGADCNRDDLMENDEMGKLLFGAFRAALPSIANDRDALHAAIDTNRATMHGLVSLAMLGQLSGGRERTAQLVEQATRQMLANTKATDQD